MSLLNLQGFDTLPSSKLSGPPSPLLSLPHSLILQEDLCYKDMIDLYMALIDMFKQCKLTRLYWCSVLFYA